METIYIKLNDQIDCAIRIQCVEETPIEDKEKAALLVLKKTMYKEVTGRRCE